MNRLNFQYKV